MKKKNKREKERKRRLLLAILMIMFVGVVLTASTYAWFTANQTVTVENIDVSVAAANGIQISVDGADWRTLVKKEELLAANATYSAAVNQIPNTMSPVSTGARLSGDIDTTTGFMKMYKGEIVDGGNGTNVLTSSAVSETHGTGGDFVAFDIFLRVSEAKTIYLTNESEVTTSDSPTKGIENAARVAFIKEGTVGTSSTVATIQGLKTPEAPIIWEPNNDAHTQSGLNNASSVYLYDGASGHPAALTADGTGAVVASYYGLINTFTKDDNVALNSTDSAKFTQVTPTIKTGTDGIPSTAYQSVFQLQAGITKVRIYMWIEGQDVDCEDGASGSNLTYALQFSILDKAP